MPKISFNLKIAGSAGEGIKSTGSIFSKTCLKFGLSTFDYTEYPSLIRGGHNTYQVHAGMEKIHAQIQNVDILIALNENAVKFHHQELTTDSILIYDQNDSHTDISKYHIKGTVYNIPLVDLAIQSGADRLMCNNVALGISVYLLNISLDYLLEIISQTFKNKGEKVITLNQKSAQSGYEYARLNLKPLSHIQINSQPQQDTITISGNESLALGAVAGGMKAYIAYPMTPASTILHVLAEWSPVVDVFVKHAEDEIGVINMALGMSYAGIRSAVGTSGGGFCYMTEAVGFAGVAELPLVIFEAQRPGPALGMPTWTAQADLQFSIWASQDEFPKIILAPGDVFEAFELSRQSFDWADLFQVPIIILSDKYLSESNQSTHFPNTKFKVTLLSRQNSPSIDSSGFYARYRSTETGITPRTVCGQPDGFYMANSYEHNAYGIGSEEIIDRTTQMNKRRQKITQIIQSIPIQFYDGSDHPEITLITWGSTLNPVREALKILRSSHIDVAAFNLSWLWPFPYDQVMNVLSKSTNPVVIEGNSYNQLAKLIRQETGVDIYHKRVKYDGRPFYPEEICAYVKDILHK